MELNLSPEELRVLGSLVEKEATTPEQYPLSVNALRSACNQKSSRDPAMNMDEAAVREAVSSLTLRGLVRTASGHGGRVSKYAHRFGTAKSGLELGPDQIAVLCILFLRGPQTAGELRTRTRRLHAFDDTAAVEATLDTLERHAAGPLVRQLPRVAGKREHRHGHCFGAEAEEPAAGAAADTTADDAAGEDVEARVAALERALQAMQEQIDRLAGRGGERR